MPTQRRFADAETLAALMREVFGTDRRITTVDRLPNGSKKGVYRVALDDRTSTIVYVWSPEEDYWDGHLPEYADDPTSPFAHSSGIDIFEAATRRLESIGARSPRILYTDRTKSLYPAQIAVTEDIPGGTLEALLENDPSTGSEALAQLAEMLRNMAAYRAPAYGNVAVVDSGARPKARRRGRTLLGQDALPGELRPPAQRSPGPAPPGLLPVHDAPEPGSRPPAHSRWRLPEPQMDARPRSRPPHQVHRLRSLTIHPPTHITFPPARNPCATSRCRPIGSRRPGSCHSARTPPSALRSHRSRCR